MSEREKWERWHLAPNWDKAITFWALLLLPNAALAINHICAARLFTSAFHRCGQFPKFRCCDTETRAQAPAEEFMERDDFSLIIVSISSSWAFGRQLRFHLYVGVMALQQVCAHCIKIYTHTCVEQQQLPLGFNVCLISGKIAFLEPKKWKWACCHTGS